MLQRIWKFLKSLIFETKQPEGLMPIPQDKDGKYMEAINDFIYREFYFTMYDFIYKQLDDDILDLYENYYAVFLLQFTRVPEDIQIKERIDKMISMFYQRVTINVLTKMSPLLKQAFYREFSPISLKNDMPESGLVDYITRYIEIKIQSLLTELVIWRERKQAELNIEVESDYWGLDNTVDYNSRDMKLFRRYSNTEIFLPRLYKLIDSGKNESLFSYLDTINLPKPSN